MPKVFMMCGKICSGKTTYAEKLRTQHKAVVLSVDEIMLALFGHNAGEKHDFYVEKNEEYLYKKSLDIIECGINVILDWGFWTADERKFAREFYASKGIDCELHYLNIDDEEWNARIKKRNAAVAANKSSAYFVDEGLAAKFAAIFEKPADDEIAMRITVGKDG